MAGNGRSGDSQSKKKDDFHDHTKTRDHTVILDKLDEFAKRNSHLQPLEPPNHLLKLELTQHQKESLGWLVQRDNSDGLPPFWEEKDGLFVRDLDRRKTYQRPKPIRGGIYAATGVGKVVTLISMIKHDKQDCSLRRRLTQKTTLILCHVHSFQDWVEKLDENIVPGSLTVFQYNELNVIPAADDLLKSDIVLASYKEFSSEACVLRKQVWRRVILDNAEHINELHRDKLKWVHSLTAEKRWIVVRDIVHLGTFLKFIKVEPFTSENSWERCVEIPIASKKPEGMARFEAVLSTICLLREVERERILPPLTLENHFVELSEREREIHSAMEAHAVAWGTGMLLYHHIPVCSDPNLFPKELESMLPSHHIQDVAEKPELQEKMGTAEADVVDCVVCKSSIPNLERIITKCEHLFCRFCILRWLRRDPRCPLCRIGLLSKDLYSRQPKIPRSTSSKAESLVQLLEKDQNFGNKSVVFSKLNMALDNLQPILEKAKYKILRYSWKTKGPKVDKVLKEFNQVTFVPTVLLARLKPGLSLDLTAATRVYFLEPWDLEEEKMAVKCVHRLGQEREVKVVRLIAQETIEDPTPIPEPDPDF
ncbi:hypothetical protein ABKV19_013853 [Rosa sericea]